MGVRRINASQVKFSLLKDKHIHLWKKALGPSSVQHKTDLPLQWSELSLAPSSHRPLGEVEVLPNSSELGLEGGGTQRELPGQRLRAPPLGAHTTFTHSKLRGENWQVRQAEEPTQRQVGNSTLWDAGRMGFLPTCLQSGGGGE